MTQKQLQILINIVGGVESGNLTYGQRDFSIYESDANSFSFGWARFKGSDAKNLIQKIYDENPSEFKKIDSNGLIQNALLINWGLENWHPNHDEADIIKKLIITDVGKDCQDKLFLEIVQPYIDIALRYDYTMSVKSQIMWCEIALIEDINACANRIFPRAKRPYTPESIYDSLLIDQESTKTGLAGSKENQSRHQKCVEWINKYIGVETQSSIGSNTISTTTSSVTTVTNTSTVNKMVNAGSGESGGWNQQKGDQTGGEVCIKNWYPSHGWNCILRYKDATVAAKIANDCGKIANSNLAGYDQASPDRNTLYKQLKANNWNVDAYIKSGVKTECDCSSFVYAVSCVHIPAMRAYMDSHGDSTRTYGMRNDWKPYGWSVLTDSKYLTSGDYQLAGDVYLNDQKHTNIAYNNGRKIPTQVVVNTATTTKPITKDLCIQALTNIASAEVGYLEKKSNADLYDFTKNAGTKNYTKYWADLYPSFQGEAWCAIFVTWIFVQAFGKDMATTLLKHYPFTYCPKLAEYTTNKTPQTGSVVLFWNGSEYSHTGFVINVTSTEITTIEGNTSGASSVVSNGGGVKKKTYSRSALSANNKYFVPDYSKVKTILKGVDLSATNSGGTAAELPTTIINSASSVTMSTDGTPCQIAFTPENKSNTFSINLSCGDKSVNINDITPNSTSKYTFTNYKFKTDEWAISIIDNTYDICKVTLYAYSGSNQTASNIVGIYTGYFYLYTPDDEDMYPNFSFSTEVYGDKTSYGFLKGYSQVRIKTETTGSYNAYSYVSLIRVGGIEYDDPGNDFISDVLSMEGENPIEIYVTDSRGRTSYAESEIFITDYKTPRINELSAFRCNKNGVYDEQGAYAYLSGTVSYTDLTQNELSIYVWVLKRNEDLSTNVYSPIFSQVVPNGFDLENFGAFPVKSDESYTVYILMNDGIQDSPLMYEYIESTFSILELHQSGTGLSVGKMATKPSAFEIGLPIETDKSISSTYSKDVSYWQMKDSSFDPDTGSISELKDENGNKAKSEIGFGIGHKGVNRGIYDNTLRLNGDSYEGEWMFYRDSLHNNSNKINGNTQILGNLQAQNIYGSGFEQIPQDQDSGLFGYLSGYSDNSIIQSTTHSESEYKIPIFYLKLKPGMYMLDIVVDWLDTTVENYGKGGRVSVDLGYDGTYSNNIKTTDLHNLSIGWTDTRTCYDPCPAGTKVRDRITNRMSGITFFTEERKYLYVRVAQTTSVPKQVRVRASYLRIQ